MFGKIKKAISYALCFGIAACAAVSAGGCIKKNGEIHFGICGSPSALYGSVTETCMTEDYVTDVQKAFGSDSARINVRFSIVFNTDYNSDEITFNRQTVQGLHSYLDKLTAAGVTRFVALTDNYLYPYDYGHSINTCVPDPLLEPEYYQRWLNINKKAWKMIAEEFPEIRYFEPTNEPDHTNGGALNKNGYSYQGRNNDDFLWTCDEAGYILADMCYYAREAVRSVNPENQVMTPGLCAFSVSFDYLQAIYDAIASETMPTGTEYAVTDPDEYFDLLNWHPYILNEGCGNIDEWKDFQTEFYSVAKKNGDDGKKVWFTELGFTDSGMGAAKEEQCAENLMRLFDYSKELGFVDTILVFCTSDLYDTPVSVTEDHFGLIRSLAEPERGGEIKPIGEALFYYMNGKDADIGVLKAAIEKNYKAFHAAKK